MRRTCRYFFTLLCAGVLATACREQSATQNSPAALEQLDQIVQKEISGYFSEQYGFVIAEEDFLADVAETEQLINHYLKTADARYTTERRHMTMLHLACAFKKPELVRTLLEDGANPDAAMKVQSGLGESESRLPATLPLTWAVCRAWEGQEYNPADVCRIIDLLLQAGAKIPVSEALKPDAPWLMYASNVCDSEAVWLHLYSKGIPAADAHIAAENGKMTHLSAATGAVLKGWIQATRQLLADQVTVQTPANNLLHIAASNDMRQEHYLDMLELLLEHPIEVDTTDENGSTPLMYVATNLADKFLTDYEKDLAARAVLKFLKKGADPYRICPSRHYPGCSPYDFIAGHPQVLQFLEKEGYKLTAPPIDLTVKGKELLTAVYRLSLHKSHRHFTEPEIENLLGLFNPAPELMQNELYEPALHVLLHQLEGVEPQRIVRHICAMPIWKSAGDCKTHNHILRSVLLHVVHHPALVLPADFVCSTAEMLAAGGLDEEAATFMELLYRSPDGRERIPHYQACNNTVLQAGAWNALLLAEGLPQPKDGCVAGWLKQRGKDVADFPSSVAQALKLTSLETFWCGQMSDGEKDELYRCMEAICPPAAAHYRRLGAALDDPEKLDEIMGRIGQLQYELEIAMARFILQHRNDFLPPAAKNTD